MSEAAAVMSGRLRATRPILRRSSLALHRINGVRFGKGVDDTARPPTGSGAFEDLRSFVKQGNEFSREVSAAMQERAHLETQYAKGLRKVATRLFRASGDSAAQVTTTVSNAWHFIAEDMEESSEVHRHLASMLLDVIVRPLKAFAETQHKSRKSTEVAVEKRAKVLNEWRTADAKTKTKCYRNTRANERVQDSLLDCKLGKGRVLSEKELVKLEGKRKKSVELVEKTDADYYAVCVKAERARLDWESSVFKGCLSFRSIEDDRLSQLRSLAEEYYQLMCKSLPKLLLSSHRLEEPLSLCDVDRDVEAIKRRIRLDEDSLGERVLPSFYPEDRSNPMNQERRREALSRCLQLVRLDLDREKKSKAGVENLARALRETPKFGGQDSQQDVKEKLHHMRSMLTFLEATKYKITNSLLETEGRPCSSHPLGLYMDMNKKDKLGMAKTVLRVPSRNKRIKQDGATDDDGDEVIQMELFAPDRGATDGSFNAAFTTTVLDGRGTADGGGEDSDFDDFSDAAEGTEPARAGKLDRLMPSSGDFTFGTDQQCSRTASASVPAERNGYNSSTSSGFASSCFPSDASPSSQANVFNGGEAEKEINEICYQATMTTFSKENEEYEGLGPHEPRAPAARVSKVPRPSASPGMGKCRVIYDYAANLYDELSIRVGDVINIHDKRDDDWWLGELGGTVGIFPATYVEEEESEA